MCNAGEDFISQRIDWQTRYTLSAKEKDKNTGYHYFGAQYYDSEVSVWLSVDPMSDFRPSLSPYNYIRWNPMNRLDPTGMLDWDPVGDGKCKAEQGDAHESATGIKYWKGYCKCSFNNWRTYIYKALCVPCCSSLNKSFSI
ncbi:MAG: hypothetical protein K9H84_03010 [Bacteroidales bacterium]|nr:hypothetical protein [Bacteroidales bacterium]